MLFFSKLDLPDELEAQNLHRHSKLVGELRAEAFQRYASRRKSMWATQKSCWRDAKTHFFDHSVLWFAPLDFHEKSSTIRSFCGWDDQTCTWYSYSRDERGFDSLDYFIKRWQNLKANNSAGGDSRIKNKRWKHIDQILQRQNRRKI